MSIDTSTTVFTAPDLSTPGSMTDAFELHRQALLEGNKLLNMAAVMRREADKAVDERGELKVEYRVRRGVDNQPETVGQTIADSRVNGFKVMADAKADNLWLMRRASMYSNEAAAHFAKASAIMSYISAQLLQNSQRKQQR